VRKVPDDEERLVDRIVSLAKQYGRYGYRRITAMLHHEGFLVNHKRVERIWRQEGLKVPQKQPKRKRLWLTDGSCIRLRPQRPNHVWSYDMAMVRTSEGRLVRILAIIDEYTRECLALYVARRVKHQDVLDNLYELFIRRGTPEYIRSDNVLSLESSFFFGYTDAINISPTFQAKSKWLPPC
jgi:transposase InsO family protein